MKKIHMLATNFLKNLGFILLTKEMRTAHDTVEIQCPNNHIFNMRYSNFYSRKKCPLCSSPNYNRNKIEYVRDCIEKEGYFLISSEYINNKKLLEMKCPFGHEFFMRFDNFNSGQRCPKCACNKKLDYDYVKSFIEKEGYALLSKEYVGATYNKLLLLCPSGHNHSTTFNNFQDGHRCKKCWVIKNRNINHSQYTGTTKLKAHLRSLLLTSWSVPVLKNSNFTCILSGEKSNRDNLLRAHHLINFTTILKQTTTRLGIEIKRYVKEYTQEEMLLLEKEVLLAHNLNMGVCITDKLHKKFHKIYGNKNNTPEQFYEFKKRYEDGEFKNE